VVFGYERPTLAVSNEKLTVVIACSDQP
jgi:hypothetical protein